MLDIPLNFVLVLGRETTLNIFLSDEIINFPGFKFEIYSLNIFAGTVVEPSFSTKAGKVDVITVSRFVTVNVTFPWAALISTFDKTGKAPFVGTALTTTPNDLLKFC